MRALERLRESGRKLILVSGRPLEDLLNLFPQIGIFNRVVAENGALLYDPSLKQETVLGPPVPESMILEMKRHGLPPFHVGRAIINAYEPYQEELLDIIHSLGLEWHLVFNKGNVMVLPSGVSKASGLRRALEATGLSRHNTIAVGDAENDHHLLSAAEVGVAVANAVPSLQEHADLITRAPETAGVVELIEMILLDDLAEVARNIIRHDILLGHEPGGNPVHVPPYGLNLMLSGEPMSGKTTLARNFLEGLTRHEYQVCIFDPEGDHLDSSFAIPLGNEGQAPVIESVINLLEKGEDSCVVNMLAIPYKERPKFFRRILPPLMQLRRRTGRPHWIAIDEAHHLLPSNGSDGSGAFSEDFKEFLFVTPALEEIAPRILKSIDLFLVAGTITTEVLQNLPSKNGMANEMLGEYPPGEVVAWWKRAKTAPFVFQAEPPSENNSRHRRKYAQAKLPPEGSFYFRGPNGKLNLKAQNLIRFVELAEGVDDETWLFHLQNGDITEWFRTTIKDPELAEVSQRAAEEQLGPDESRKLIREMVEKRYTGPV